MITFNDVVHNEERLVEVTIVLREKDVFPRLNNHDKHEAMFDMLNGIFPKYVTIDYKGGEVKQRYGKHISYDGCTYSTTQEKDNHGD